MSNTENNKKIATNTMLLYFRTLLTMLVSLYTSRIILNTLGVVDFGIYNVVGGVVAMFSFLHGAMATGTQRFLSFEIGKKDFVQLGKVFNMSVNIHVIISLIILFFAETIGLWFLNTHLVLPPERMEAANWVYQFSILTFMITIWSVPYDASIIAHERMSAYAYVSIAEVALKLLIVFMLQWIVFDKLKLYGILVFGVSVLIRIIYGIYCKRNFSECKYQFSWDKELFKTMLSFNGWNLWGNIAAVTYNQGINILLNIFFGPVVNAARGITFQVNGAVNAFVSNFQMAMNPQIVKSFASDNIKFMHELIYKGAKYSYFLLLFLVLPVIIETKIILLLWLKIVPDYTVIFCRLILLNSLIDSLSGTIGTSVLASGKIKKYHLLVGGLQLLILPLSYLFLKLGYPPQTTLYISIFFSVLSLFSRLIITSPLVNLSIMTFVKSVLVPIAIVTVIAVILPLIVSFNFEEGIGRLLIVCVISVLSVTASIYRVGLKVEEQNFMKLKLKQIIAKIKLN